MIDLYLHAPTREALLADLKPLGIAMDMHDGVAPPRHALLYIGNLPGLEGVYACLRCFDDTLASEIRQAKCKAVSVIDRPEGAPVFAGTTETDLEAVKTAACAAIDAEAERRRMLALTPGAGQALEYQYTAEEAARAVAAPEPLAQSAYPFLAAEQTALRATIGEVPLRDVAVAVLADRAAWMAYGAAIKAVRRQAKLLVRAAADPAAVAGVVAGIAWPEKL